MNLKRLEKCRNGKHSEIDGKKIDMEGRIKMLTEPTVNPDGSIRQPRCRHHAVARRWLLLDKRKLFGGVFRKNQLARAERKLGKAICQLAD